jgi:hypothetical protein
VSRSRLQPPTTTIRFGTEATTWPVEQVQTDRFVVGGGRPVPTQATVATFEIDPNVSISVRVHAPSSPARTFEVVGPDSLALMPVVGRLTRTRLDARSAERPSMSARAVSVPLPAHVPVRLAGHAELLRVDRLDADGFVVRTRALAVGVRTTATFEASSTIRVRVAVIAGDVDLSDHQSFRLAQAADAPLLALVASLSTATRNATDDLPPATVLPASVTVLPFVVPTLR